MDDLTQDEAWAAGATRVPEEIVGEVYETTNDGRPTGWPKFFDRTGEVWEETGERHDEDVVMMPGSGWVPMLRRDVQAFWGPLVAEGAYDEFVSAVNRRQALAYATAQEALTEETMMTTHPADPPSTDSPPGDPRLALLRALNTPPYDLAAGKTSTPLNEAVQLIDAYRAAVLHEVADRYQDYIDNADTSADPRYWTGIRDMTLGLRRVAAEKAGPAGLLNATEATDG